MSLYCFYKNIYNIGVLNLQRCNNLNENNPEFNGLVSQCKGIFIDYIMIFNK